MRSFVGKGLLGLTLLLVATAAWAGIETAWFSLATLEAFTGASETYRVYPDNYTLDNPAHCTVTSYAEILTSATAAERDLMSKTLLAAFLSGRKIKLGISSTQCSVSNAPAYYMVRLNSSQ
jgi:hypothetical protein